MVPSTGSAGDGFDNAMAESSFATLECEFIEDGYLPKRPAFRPGLPQPYRLRRRCGEGNAPWGAAQRSSSGSRRSWCFPERRETKGGQFLGHPRDCGVQCICRSHVRPATATDSLSNSIRPLFRITQRMLEIMLIECVENGLARSLFCIIPHLGTVPPADLYAVALCFLGL